MPYDPADGLISGANLVGGLIQQTQRTQSYVNDQFDTAARRRAGGLIARGDVQGAAGVLGERGMLTETDALMGRANAQNVLTASSAGNHRQARATAAEAGDPALYGAATTAQATEQAQRTQFLTRAADVLLQIPAPINPQTQQPDTTQRRAAFQTLIPTLRAMGMPESAIEIINDDHLTDSELQSFRTAVAGAEELDIRIDQTTGDVFGTNRRTGQVMRLREGDPAPRIVDGVVYSRNRGGSTPAAPGVAAPAAPAATPAATVTARLAAGPRWEAVSAAVAPLNPTPEEIVYLRRTYQVESAGGADTRSNGSSQGDFQFLPATFRSVMPNGNIDSPADQAQAALLLARRAADNLRERLGREPTPAEIYMVHQQGDGGGTALLTAPVDRPAVEVLTPFYRARFGDRAAAVARRAVTGNGGRADMTAGEFSAYLQNRFNTGETRPPPRGAAGAAPPPPPAPPAETGAAATTDMGNGWTATPAPLSPREQAQQAAEAERLRLAQNADARAARTEARQDRPSRILTPREARQRGLSPTQIWQVDGQNRVTGLGNNGQITAPMRESAGYAYRARDGMRQMLALERQGIARPTAQLLISERNGVARLVARNPDDARFVAAANAFLLPIIRDDTGAAVTAAELQTYLSTYMPEPGDSPALLAQKAEARQTLLRGLVGRAGPAYEDMYGRYVDPARRPRSAFVGATATAPVTGRPAAAPARSTTTRPAARPTGIRAMSDEELRRIANGGR